MKNWKYHPIRTTQKSNRKITETKAKYIPQTWLSTYTGTYTISGEVNLVVRIHIYFESNDILNWSSWSRTYGTYAFSFMWYKLSVTRDRSSLVPSD